MSDESRPATRDPGRLACLTQVLTRKSRSDQVNVREISELGDISMQGNRREAIGEYTGSCLIPLAQHSRLMTCIVQPRLDTPDARKEASGLSGRCLDTVR